MNTWAKIGLSALAGAAIVGVYFGDEYYTKKEETEKEQASKAIVFDTTDVRKILLTNEMGTFAVSRDSATSDWTIKAPTNVAADQDTINNFLSALQSQSTERELPDTAKAASLQGEEAAKFGLTKPRASVELTLADNKTKKLIIGDDLKVGNESGGSFMAVSVYAVNPERKNLLILSSNILSTLKKNFSDLRTKIAGNFVVNDVKSFRVEQKGEKPILLVKGEKEWRIQEPRDMLADQNNIGLFLDRWSKLRLDNVVEASSITAANKNDWNLNNASHVTFMGSDNKTLQALDAGFTKEKIYVSMADGAVGTVDVGQLPDLFPNVRYFRDRRVMRDIAMADIVKIETPHGRVYQKEGNNWYAISGPGIDKEKQNKDGNADAARLYSDWEFMAADDILEGTQTADLSKYGLNKPVAKFSFLFSENSKKAPEQILVGSRVPHDEKKVYIKRSSQNNVYIVETNWLDNLTKLDEVKPKPTVTPDSKSQTPSDAHAQK